MRAALALVALAACDPIYSLDVAVTDPDGAPVANASLALTACGDRSGDEAARLTDAQGRASVGGLGFAFPPCAITVAHPGFQPFESSFDELCGVPLDDCDRVRSIEVVLAPNP